MKHIFIINPAAGQGKARSYWLPRIQKLVKQRQIDYELHNTLSFQEGVNYIRQRCETGEELRFYGCGGDGTLNCLISGAYGYSNASVGVLPTGTGNDFVRNFTDPAGFRDLDRQLDGKELPIDLIRCTDEDGVRLSVNMCNIGVDAAVADVTAAMKKKPLISGPMAYGVSIAKVLAGKIGFPAAIRFDDEPESEEDILLAAVGNGGFCGGGFHAAPVCRVDDGFLDVCCVRNINKAKIASVIMKYRAGTHLTDKSCDGLVIYRQCKKFTLTPLKPEDEDVEKMAVDGEISNFRETTFEIMPNAVKFIVPAGCKMASGG